MLHMPHNISEWLLDRHIGLYYTDITTVLDFRLSSSFCCENPNIFFANLAELMLGPKF